MEYKVTIPGRLAGLNELINATPMKKAGIKRKNGDACTVFIRNRLHGVTITNPIILHYSFYERDRRRDKMNIFSAADKFFQDALVSEGVIVDDGWRYVENTTHEFFIDQKNPRIEVVIEEVG